MPTEKDILNQFAQGNISLSPLTFRIVEMHPLFEENRRLGALIRASWNGSSVMFAVECKSISTPKAFQTGLDQLKATSLPNEYLPMLIMPYFSEEQLLKLEKAGVSGIDLSGNAVVVVPGVFALYRSGGKNRYPSSASIKNIYRMNSSMVGRVFFSRSSYQTVGEIQAEVNERNLLVNRGEKTPMSLSTVSKTLKSLENDLIVAREPFIRLLQADTLLDKLSMNYIAPKVRETIRLKIPGNNGALLKSLARQARETGVQLVATGLSSVTRYAVMQRGEMISLYCPRLGMLLERMPGNPSERFPNVEIFETEDEAVYFDALGEDGFMWASPVQTYLELMAGDKRDRETALQVRSYIVSRLESEEIQP